MLLTVVLLVLLPVKGVAQEAGARSPSFAADGRLVFAQGGDLWVVADGVRGGDALRLTRGPAWDRDPSWSPDGGWVVFVSDRGGRADLWRIAVGAARAAGEPVRLTASTEPDGEPSVRGDGSVVFVRGSGGGADLWLRDADGAERRLTESVGAEREPAWSPDGSSIAYVEVRGGRRALRILVPGESDVVIDSVLQAERPVWSPDGERLAFAGGGRTAGLWVMARDGSYVVKASHEAGAAAWSPDGEWLVVTGLAPPDIGYNGDPDRLGARVEGDPAGDDGGIRLVRAPTPVGAAEPVPIRTDAPRSERNRDAYDRVWQRVADLYMRGDDAFSREALAAWQRAADRHREAAVAAATEAELGSAIHGLVRERPPLRPVARGRAAVSSAHSLASAAGAEILEAGGNVVDAAVAVSFALGVVEPDASGVGGYGEMLIHLEGMEEPVAIEFMTRLPEDHQRGLAEIRGGDAHGALLANVPGTVAGMELAWRRHGSGRLAWSRLLEPAIRLAESGFALDDALATTLAREQESFSRYPSSRALFFRADGRPLQAGDTLRNPDLAWTLRQIAEGGADAFYRGEIAERLVRDLRERGHGITLLDMRRYFAADRRPVRTTYRGHDIYSGPPPVTGGAVLLGKLNLLELAEPGTSVTEDVAKLHAMLEAWKLQPSTGDRIADPDLWPTDVSPFERKDTAAARWHCFDPRAASTADMLRRGCAAAADSGSDRDRPDSREGGAEAYGSSPDAEDADQPCAIRPNDRGCRNTGTTAFAVADGEGNAVSVTQTLGTWGGNFYVTPGLGFLYNDKFTSYRSEPSAYGARLPYARNTTIISPTIVYDGEGSDRRPLLALGAAGNAWITSAVYAMVVGVIDHGLDVQAALELPRLLPGGSTIQIEDGFSPDAIRDLEAMGHTFRRISLKGELRMGYGAAVMVRDGHAVAGADPRRSGGAAAVR
jgi:gamma-glutamyltranspeptidase